MITDEKTWVVMADGGNAKVMEYHSMKGGLEPVPEGEFHQPNLPTRDLVTDKPARGYISNNSNEARGAVDPGTDAHNYEEFRFVGNVARFLDDHVEEFDNLIVMAAPKALGTLRQKMSPNVQKKVYAQLDKDLVKRPVDEVLMHLQELMPDTSRPH